MTSGSVHVMMRVGSCVVILIAFWLSRAPAVGEALSSQARQVHSSSRHVARSMPVRKAAYDRVRAISRQRALDAIRHRQEMRKRAQRAAEAVVHNTLWLHAVGTQLYTAWNGPVTLKAINWYGFEYAPFVPDGLDHASLDSILATIRSLGFNALRIPFADETVQRDPVVKNGIDANPRFRGWHALDIMQAMIHRAHHFGLRIVLVNTRSEAGRGPELLSGMWYTKDYPESVWIADWVKLTTRFRNESAFVGADLRNEPHITGASLDEKAYFNNGPIWGAYQGTYYHDRDWHYAAQTLGNTLLGINPHLLIIVEGVQMYLDPDKNVLTGGLWGSNLVGVQYDVIQLTHQSQLVYSVHEYGPHMWQGDWFSPKTTYGSLATRWDALWGYLLTASRALRAPIFVGEFGTCHEFYSCVSSNEGWKQGFWFKSFVRYLHEHPQVGWAYWALNPMGPFHAEDSDFYSLVSADWKHYYPLIATGLGPLLREPDGIWNAPHLHSRGIFPAQPGCSANASCTMGQDPQGASHRHQMPTSPPPAHAVRATFTLPYIQPADKYRIGDLYMPQGPAAQRRPAVILVHGSTWSNGRKGTPDMVALARGLAWHGYVTYDIAYRLTGEGGAYPHDIQDIKDAIAYLTVNAQRFNIDPTKISVIGSDAGGYLAMMAAYTPNRAPFIAPHYPGVQARASAVGNFFGPSDLRRLGHRNVNMPDLQGYLGTSLDQRLDLYLQASPSTYINSAIPTILFHGVADTLTPFAQSYRLFSYLKQRTVQSQLIDLPGAPHGIASLTDPQRRTAVTQVVTFLDGVFYKRPWHGGR